MSRSTHIQTVHGDLYMGSNLKMVYRYYQGISRSLRTFASINTVIQNPHEY